MNGSALAALPFLFVLAIGIFPEGGDWPPAAFLVRAALFLLAARFLVRTDAVAIRLNAIDLCVVLLLAVEAASLARAQYRWVSYQWFLHHAAAFALYGLLRARQDPAGRLPAAVGALLVAAAVVEIPVAAYQKFALADLRPAGTLRNPNLLAEFLLYGAVAAFLFAGRDVRGGALRWAAVPLAALCLAGIGLTGSRAGFLLVIPAGFFLAGRRYGWRRTAVALLLFAAVLLAVSNPFFDRDRWRGDPFALQRLSMWKAAVRIFADHPWGVGVGHFKYYFQAARDPVAGTVIRYARFALTPHNEFLSVLSELGIAGAAAFLGLAAAILAALRRAVRTPDPAATGAAAVLLVSGLHAVLETNYHVPGVLLVNAAALAVLSGRPGPALAEREVRIKGVVRWTGVALLLAMTAYSGMTLAGAVLEKSGRAALADGRAREAERRFLLAASADPLRATAPDAASAARFAIHEAGKDPGDLSAAIASENAAIERNPCEPLYAARLGFLLGRASAYYRGEGRDRVLAAGLAAYDRALMLNPRAAEMKYQKAVLLAAAGRAGEARDLLRSLLAEEPGYARGWVLLGELLESEDRTMALDAYRKALDAHTRFGNAARDQEEKDFTAIDVEAVRRRIRGLGGRAAAR